MKKIVIIVIAILFVILAIKLKDSFSININSKSTGGSKKIISPSPSSSNSLEAKESNEGPVAIVVTPRNLESSSSAWDFEIALNTHSEDLNADLVAVSELVDDQGKSHKPVSWEGTAPGGHHREGFLKFNPILPQPKSLELKIKNVGGIPERSFKWNI